LPRVGEKEIFVYNKNGDHIRTHKRSYTPKDWVIIPADMPDSDWRNHPEDLDHLMPWAPEVKAECKD